MSLHKARDVVPVLVRDDQDIEIIAAGYRRQVGNDLIAIWLVLAPSPSSAGRNRQASRRRPFLPWDAKEQADRPIRRYMRIVMAQSPGRDLQLRRPARVWPSHSPDAFCRGLVVGRASSP